VRGQGTTILKNVEGREDSDTIKILDGATVNGYVSGGKGENPSAYGAAADSDGNKITIENATVKGNVEGSTYGGDNKITILNSKMYMGIGKLIKKERELIKNVSWQII